LVWRLRCSHARNHRRRQSNLGVLIGDSEPQADSCLRIDEEYGGRSWVDEEGYLTGSPEWVGEVSFSSIKIDLEKKLPMYEKNGIREFVLWRVPDKAIDWFILKQGKYESLAKSKDGLYKSKVFPGLWLDAAAMISGDFAQGA
jgi:hypothetical protein